MSYALFHHNSVEKVANLFAAGLLIPNIKPRGRTCVKFQRKEYNEWYGIIYRVIFIGCFASHNVSKLNTELNFCWKATNHLSHSWEKHSFRCVFVCHECTRNAVKPFHSIELFTVNISSWLSGKNVCHIHRGKLTLWTPGVLPFCTKQLLFPLVT